MPLTLNDVKRILKLLGPVGTIAGLEASDLARDTLIELCHKAKISVGGDSSRYDSIRKLIANLNEVNLKPTAELLQMSYDELVQYFAHVAPSNEDLMKIMKELNYKVGAQDMKHLRRFVARQISETALFSDVASGPRADRGR